MRELPSYMHEESSKESTYGFVAMLAVCWTLTVLISFLFISKQTVGTTDNLAPTGQNLSPWVSSTAEKINQIRKLTLHLARDYQTVEFLADTSESGDQISEYWKSFKEQHPYIAQVGVVEEESSDHFYIGNFTQLSTEGLAESDELINYWMQVGLLNNNDILFYEFSGNEQGVLFRFTTPVHYESMRLGHLYIDLDVSKLLSDTAEDLSNQPANESIIMLDKEGNYVAETNSTEWSAKRAFEQSIGYYYPEFWRGMNSGLSGQFSTVSQTALFSKLDIPWYENQIKYFYLIQISDKDETLISQPQIWQPALIIWITGLLGLWLMHRRLARLAEHKSK